MTTICEQTPWRISSNEAPHHSTGPGIVFQRAVASFIAVATAATPGYFAVSYNGTAPLGAAALHEADVVEQLGCRLVKDVNGELASGAFSYSSVVGMLLYLSGHTRPDITFAVNCCACYKHSHELALKCIGHYLKQTSDRGMVMGPSSDVCKIDAVIMIICSIVIIINSVLTLQVSTAKPMIADRVK